MPADPALTQSRPSVPDLKTGYCIHHPACTECGEHHFQPRAGECRDCIDLALAAAREEGEEKVCRTDLAEANLLLAEQAADLAAARERNEELEMVRSAAYGLLTRLDVVLPRVPWVYLYGHGFLWTKEEISAEDELKALRDALQTAAHRMDEAKDGE